MDYYFKYCSTESSFFGPFVLLLSITLFAYQIAVKKFSASYWRLPFLLTLTFLACSYWLNFQQVEQGHSAIEGLDVNEARPILKGLYIVTNYCFDINLGLSLFPLVSMIPWLTRSFLAKIKRDQQIRLEKEQRAQSMK